MKTTLTIFLLIIVQSFIFGQDSIPQKPYIFYPGSYPKWKHKFSTSISLTRLPTEIIEEEINSVPMIHGDFRIGLPKKFMFQTSISSNYISNMLSLSFQKSVIDKKFSLALGAKTSFWYGQLYQDVIRLRAVGFILNPYIVGGIHLKDYYLSVKFENQYATMRTFSDDAMLGKSSQPNSAYSISFSIEQPLWDNHWVALGAKFNYAKFQYQSWLAYNAIKTYLLYPEFSFTYIF